MNDVATAAKRWSLRINWVVERLCVTLLVVLVLDVWLGVLARYVLPFRLTFTEELARYLMIWMALLAVSCGIAYREHIGVEFIFMRLPARIRRWLALAFDITAFAFFRYPLLLRARLHRSGIRTAVTMIYQIPKGWFFAGVPLCRRHSPASSLRCWPFTMPSGTRRRNGRAPLCPTQPERSDGGLSRCGGVLRPACLRHAGRLRDRRGRRDRHSRHGAALSCRWRRTGSLPVSIFFPSSPCRSSFSPARS